MKAYILTEKDFELLNSALAEDPAPGIIVQNEKEREMHNAIYRRFNFIVRRWISEVQK